MILSFEVGSIGLAVSVHTGMILVVCFCVFGYSLPWRKHGGWMGIPCSGAHRTRFQSN